MREKPLPAEPGLRGRGSLGWLSGARATELTGAAAVPIRILARAARE